MENYKSKKDGNAQTGNAMKDEYLKNANVKFEGKFENKKANFMAESYSVDINLQNAFENYFPGIDFSPSANKADIKANMLEAVAMDRELQKRFIPVATKDGDVLNFQYQLNKLVKPNNFGYTHSITPNRYFTKGRQDHMHVVQEGTMNMNTMVDIMNDRGYAKLKVKEFKPGQFIIVENTLGKKDKGEIIGNGEGVIPRELSRDTEQDDKKFVGVMELDVLQKDENTRPTVEKFIELESNKVAKAVDSIMAQRIDELKEGKNLNTKIDMAIYILSNNPEKMSVFITGNQDESAYITLKVDSETLLNNQLKELKIAITNRTDIGPNITVYDQKGNKVGYGYDALSLRANQTLKGSLGKNQYSELFKKKDTAQQADQKPVAAAKKATTAKSEPVKAVKKAAKMQM